MTTRSGKSRLHKQKQEVPVEELPQQISLAKESLSLEKTANIQTTTLPTSTPLAWLTVERALYVAIILFAIALRGWQLGAYPLSNTEAEHSLVAWQIYHGETPTSGSYSPLLVSMNVLLFFLFGASDALARIPTLLLGTLLVVIPMTMTRQLGAKLCLTASALFAISPTVVYLSRTLNAEIGVAVGSLMIVAGFLNWGADRAQHWLWLFAVGLAILLASGPLSFSVIVVFALLILIGMAIFFGFSTQLAMLWISGLVNPESTMAEEELPFSKEDVASEVITSTDRQNWQQAGLLFLITLFLITTAATLNMSGFSVLTNGLTTWLGYFNLTAQPEAGYNAVFLLSIYEPILLIFGLVGLGYAMFRNNLLGLAFGGWFVGLLLLDVLMGARPQGTVILPLVPIAMLAASAIAALWASLEDRGSWPNEGILIATGLVIAVFAYIGLTGWLDRGCVADDPYCLYAWVQPVAALVLFLTVSAMFAFISEPGVSWRGVGGTMLAVTLLMTTNAGVRLNYGPLEDYAYQPLAGQPVSTEFHDMTGLIIRQSNERAFGATLMDVLTVDVDSPALQWQLREFPNLSQSDLITELPTATAIITPPDESKSATLGENYVGQSFTLDALWSPMQLQDKTLISWYIYRTAKERPTGNQVVLWSRLGD
ncbi:hypothetical protein QUF63_15070 [Anaerolineales bacterium HSG25]|nr:hypothetical protein [Anaerolineales bacterium HSG25]